MAVVPDEISSKYRRRWKPAITAENAHFVRVGCRNALAALTIPSLIWDSVSAKRREIRVLSQIVTMFARKQPTPSSRTLAGVVMVSLDESIPAVIDGVLRRMVGATDPDYEDLLQTALEKLLVTVAKDPGRTAASSSLPLAATIARNIVVDALRARSRERRVFVRDYPDELATNVPGPEREPEQLAHVRRELHQLVRALARVGDRTGDVVYLHDVLGYGLDDVAAMVGASVAAAQSRLVRGRRRVITKMKKALPAPPPAPKA
jgi:RNA polymerase sigma factor (sigma-70 family)